MLALYQNEGIIAEPAGALAAAALRELELTPGSTVVVAGLRRQQRCRRATARSSNGRWSTQGLKHYFLVDFPQEPGALRRFLDEVLGPDDDITLFEYVKRNNRETGAALVGIELGTADGLDGAAGPDGRRADGGRADQPGSAAYRLPDLMAGLGGSDGRGATIRIGIETGCIVHEYRRCADRRRLAARPDGSARKPRRRRTIRRSRSCAASAPRWSCWARDRLRWNRYGTARPWPPTTCCRAP